MATDRSSAPRSIGEIAEAWCDGSITSAEAMERGDFDGFAELLDFSIRSDVPLRTRLSQSEESQAELFTSLLQRS